MLEYQVEEAGDLVLQSVEEEVEDQPIREVAYAQSPVASEDPFRRGSGPEESYFHKGLWEPVH